MKNLLRQFLPPILVNSVAFLLRSIRNRSGSTFSNLDEESIIRKYLEALGIKERFCVDIAASDGITMSNTLFLFRQGWNGIAVEYDAIKFSKLAGLYASFPDCYLIKTKVTPDNVIAVLEAGFCPEKFAFLNFDIDSYDFFVLEKLLSKYRPSLVCLEINEKIPPPISFSVLYDADHYWKEDHFYGQSISQAEILCKKFSYDIVELHYNNLFIVPREINTAKALSVEDAYDVGYRNKPDRKSKFPWNEDMEALLTMQKKEGIEFLREKFKSYSGKFLLN